MLRATSLLSTFALLAAALSAQDAAHPSRGNLLARLSYNSTLAKHELNRNVCVAVWEDGSYRAMLPFDNEQMTRLKGKLPQEQLQQLKSLLGDREFQSLSGNHGGLIRNESANFRAEVPRADNVQRVQWLQSDEGTPFPVAVSNVVEWLQHFQPSDSERFDEAEYRDICPSGGLRYVQPTVAANQDP